MQIAILGPVCKDSIQVDDVTRDQLGGIPYYTGVAMCNLGADVTAYITYNSADDVWVRDNFKGVSIRHIEAPGTLHFSRIYSSQNPDVCLSVKIGYFPNPIMASPELLQELKEMDYIILSPLLHDNLSPEFFKQVKEGAGKPIVHGNFGMFTYAINNEFVQKNPEQFMAAAPYIDYLFLDEKEIQFATSTANVTDAVKTLQKLGVKEIMVTNGSKGSTIFINTNTYQIPAYPPTNVVDPTGAGDTYLAGYMTALGLFGDPIQRGKFAAMTATLSLEKRGAFSESKERVLERLRKNGESF
jgi:sugar/nucleoside kinase (ribokinase family)